MKKIIITIGIGAIMYVGYIYLNGDLDRPNIQNEDVEIKEETKTVSLLLPKEKVYLAIGEKYTLSATVETSNNKEIEIIWTSENSDVALIEDGKVTGVTAGNSIVTVETADGVKKNLEVVISDLIILPAVNSNKTHLPCNNYSKEQADLLDEILFAKIDDAGYGTRSGPVAAARFLLLEFPYTIRYFNENGRLNNHSGQSYVDGEGRYYHRGLYLHESKFENLVASKYGAAPWGCNIWDAFVSRYSPNGLTCSGFVTWTLLNGGFDVGDSGAGNTFREDDVSDLGENVPITKELMESGKVKIGDIIGRDGHVAIIIGLDDTNIYIAEALPTTVRVVTLTKLDGLLKSTNFTYIILMDHVYKDDGNLTNMW